MANLVGVCESSSDRIVDRFGFVVMRAVYPQFVDSHLSDLSAPYAHPLKNCLFFKQIGGQVRTTLCKAATHLVDKRALASLLRHPA